MNIARFLKYVCPFYNLLWRLFNCLGVAWKMFRKKLLSLVKLTNFPRNHNVSFSFSQFKYLDDAYNSECQRKLIESIENDKDLQKNLLAYSEIWRHLREEIDLQVTDGRLNDVRVRNKLNPLYKNVLQRQNPYEIVFRYISKFNWQNPIIESLLTEIESGNCLINQSWNSWTVHLQPKI